MTGRTIENSRFFLIAKSEEYRVPDQLSFSDLIDALVVSFKGEDRLPGAKFSFATADGIKKLQSAAKKNSLLVYECENPARSNVYFDRVLPDDSPNVVGEATSDVTDLILSVFKQIVLPHTQSYYVEWEKLGRQTWDGFLKRERELLGEE